MFKVLWELAIKLRLDHGEIKTALDDNLCRCGVQNRILAAVAEVVTARDGAA